MTRKRATQMPYKRLSLVGMLFAIIILSLFLASAQQQSLGNFKQNSCFNLIQECGTCTYNNVTSIISPDGTQALGVESNMTKVGTEYLFNFCNTSMLGNYIVNGHGDLSGINTAWNYGFVISPNGKSQTTAQGIGSAVYLFLIVFLIALFGYLGFRLGDSEWLWIFGIFFLFLSLLLCFYGVWLGYEYHLNLTGINDGSHTPEIIFYIFTTILIAGFFVSGALVFTKFKKVREMWEKAKREEEELNNEKDWE